MVPTILKKIFTRRAWIPNLITLLNLFSGFLAILMIVHRDYIKVVWLMLIALIWDSLDGHVARRFAISTRYGKELDSLADLVSFVVVPALFALNVVFLDLFAYFFLVVFIFLGCGAVRLARFNIEGGARSFFSGLPTPAAGLTLAVCVQSCYRWGWNFSPLCVNLTVSLMLILAALMVSSVRYPKLTAIPFHQWRFFFYFMIALLVTTAGVFDFVTAVAVVLAFYVLFSPLYFRSKYPKIKEDYAYSFEGV